MKKKNNEGKRSWLVKDKGELVWPGMEGSAQEGNVVDEVLNLEKLKEKGEKIAQDSE